MTRMGPIAALMSSFAQYVADGRAEIYNEFSLQHELGIFLRHELPAYRVQFERNVRYFFPDVPSWTKREIDIVVFSPEPRQLQYAVELKFPRNGQHPEQMFSFCRDVAFVEELHRAGFASAALVAVADDPLFYRGATAGIYAYFRGGEPLCGRIEKPTGRKDENVTLRGTYAVSWQPIQDPLRYLVIEVAS